MTGPPNFAVGPVALTPFYLETRSFSAGVNFLTDLFELSHLKMEVSVSEPCDVIRVVLYVFSHIIHIFDIFKKYLYNI